MNYSNFRKTKNKSMVYTHLHPRNIINFKFWNPTQTCISKTQNLNTMMKEGEMTNLQNICLRCMYDLCLVEATNEYQNIYK